MQVKIVVIPSIIIYLGTLITNICFGSYYKQYDLDNTFIPKLKIDLETKLIYNFTESDSGNCLEGEELLDLGTWYGPVNRCKCSNKTEYGICRYNDINCTTIGNQKKYTKINGKYICVKRQGKTFRELIKSNMLVSKDQNCPNNFNPCGIIDTQGRKLCVEDNICPITNIYIESNNLLLEERKYQNYNSVNLDDDNDDKKIMSIFEISEDFPCINPAEQAWNNYDYNYKNYHKICSKVNGKYNDDRYIKFSKYNTTIKDLYKDNDLNEYINSYLENDTNNVYLYGRTLYGLNIDNEDNEIDKIKDYQDKLNKYGKALDIITSINYIVIILLPLACLYLCCACIGGAVGTDCCEGCGILGMFSLGLAIIVCFLSSIIYFIMDCLVFSAIINLYSIFDVISENEEFLKKLFELIKDSYASNYRYSLSTMILNCISFVGLCVGTYFMWKNKNSIILKFKSNNTNKSIE